MFKLLKVAAVPNVRIESVSVTPYFNRYMRYHSQPTFGGTPFRDVIGNDYILLQPLSNYGVFISSDGTQPLSLKSPETVKLNFGVTAVSVRNNLDGDESTLLQGTIFVRSFYGRLAKQLISRKWSILLGNPGVSKSWFQWYLLYCIANKCGCYDSTESPRLIVRQVEGYIGGYMNYYFPQSEEVYESKVTASILRMLDRCTTLYLYEPKDELKEPFYAACGGRPIQIIATCSPDERRYKEFKKKRSDKVLYALLDT